MSLENGDYLEHYFTNNLNTKSELRLISYKYGDIEFAFSSDNGIFSKDKIDYGSRLLVENIVKSNKKYEDILDVGCGIGFIGITLSKILNIFTMMIDINKRAVHLTEKNIIYNKVNSKVIESDIYSNITDKYSLVVTNPPIRAGKEVILKILLEARNYLRDDGELWFVMRKNHGVLSILKMIENTYKCQIIDKSKGFYIIMAKVIDKE